MRKNNHDYYSDGFYMGFKVATITWSFIIAIIIFVVTTIKK